MNGWIKLHRKLLDNPNVRDPDWLAVWLFLLLNAAHARNEGRTVRVGLRKSRDRAGHAIEHHTLHAGKLVTTIPAIARAMGVDESKVYRVLKLMENEEQIEIQPSNKSSMITVLNWRRYQKVKDKLQDN